jgi:penicillin amidase
MTDIAIAPPTSGPPPERSGTRTGLGRPFWRTWSADLASGLGEGVRIGALPLLAASLSSSPAQVAAVWVAGGLPFLLVGPFSGVLSDRWRRHRRVMWLTDAVAAVATLVFALLVAGGMATIAVLAVFNFLVGSLATLRDNAATAIIPQLVPRHLLGKANSRVESAQLLTIDLLGPPLGAMLFLLPPGMPFFLDAASYALAGLLVFGLPRQLPVDGAAPLPPAEPRSRAGVLAEMGEGARWLWRHPALRAVCVLLAGITLAVLSAMSVAVLYAFEVLEVGHGMYVVLLAVIALGAVLGSVAAPALAARLGRAGALRAAFVLAPAAFLVAGLTSDALVATAALTAVGATVGISNVISVTLRHELVPPALMGRVNSTYRLVAVGAGPLGAGLGGLFGELFGLRAPMLLSAAAAGAGLLVAFFLVPRTIGADADQDTDTDDPGPPGGVPAVARPAPPARPRRRRRLRRAAAGLVVLAVLAVTAATGYGTWTVRRSFPAVSGDVAVPGLSAPVDVVRDAAGVPQIYADTPRDLFLAQGYVHAQDRFWQMDTQRAIAAGRLAAMFGPDQVETDTVVRTLGFQRAAEAELALLSAPALANLQAYADGVNAYLADRGGAALSVEYAVLGLVAPDYRPAPWTVVDSVAWLKALAWNLRGNDFEETQRALLSADLPADRVEQLFPTYDFTRQRPITDEVPAGAAERAATALPSAPGAAADGSGAAPLLEVGAATDRLEGLLGPSGPGIGSNSWVVAGERTASGQPMLANDPHLGPQLPSIWYQVGLHCREVGPACPYDVSGFGFAGMPAVFIGHNADITWGLTNLGADVVDLYLEKVDGRTYEYRGEQLPLQTREEVIEVAGGDPVTVTVSATRHGPILSGVDPDLRAVGEVARSPELLADATDGAGYAVALRWSALEPGATLDSVFAINLAHDWDSFREALRGFGAPAQSVVYADRQGHIGFQAIGRVPVRSTGDGRYPVPGWTGEHEWTGWIPFDDLPRELDPARGYVVTANNAAAGPDYPYLITGDWPDGYRSERIAELVEQGGRLDADDMRRIQSDTLSPYAAVLVPHLLRVEPGADAGPARELLRGWDGSQPADSAAAAYFNAVFRALLRLTFTDDLSRTAADPDPSGGGRWLDVVGGLLDRPEDPYWRNDADPRGLRTRDDVLRAAQDDAAAELTARLGPDPAGWRWGELHTLTLQNSTLGGGPAPVRMLLNDEPRELGGGNSAVDATGWDARDGYQVDWIPSMRMVVDVADWDASGWVNQAGASGHTFAGTYTDQTGPWTRGETLPWAFSPAAVDAAARDQLVLRPPAGP